MADESGSGAKVWLDLDQAALDRSYDQAQYAANMQQVLGRFEWLSEQARERLGTPTRHRYGPGAAEELDRFVPGPSPEDASTGRPALLFIHGGAWRGGLARNYAFVAEPFVAVGCAVLIADFAPVTDLDGDLDRMTDQIRRVIAWVGAQAPALGIDRSRVHLVGHSSGGHLAAAASATDWQERFSLVGSPIASLTVCCGLYDLRPVRLSARSRYLSLTDECVERLSPIRHLHRLRVPLMVAWGSFESPEFQRQARDYADAADAAGVRVTRLVAEGYNHFEVLETLANPHGLLGHALIEAIRADRTAASGTAEPDLPQGHDQRY